MNPQTGQTNPARELCMSDRKDTTIRRSARLIAAMALLTMFTTSMVLAQNTPSFPDITAISLEDLLNLKVTSVSKREQKLADAPAAIFVVTQEEIRRSGARSIPEALRMVPGLQVDRIDENKWAISSRGFNGRFANKLLVLIMADRFTPRSFRVCIGTSRMFCCRTSTGLKSFADRVRPVGRESRQRSHQHYHQTGAGYSVRPGQRRSRQ